MINHIIQTTHNTNKHAIQKQHHTATTPHHTKPRITTQRTQTNDKKHYKQHTLLNNLYKHNTNKKTKPNNAQHNHTNITHTARTHSIHTQRQH